VIDGSNRYDPYATEQSVELKEAFTEIYRRSGIVFDSPCYDEGAIKPSKGLKARILRTLRLYKDATDYRVQYLESVGINMGKGFVSQYRHTQPSCKTSIVFNGVRALLQLFFVSKIDGYLSYIKDRQERAGK